MENRRRKTLAVVGIVAASSVTGCLGSGGSSSPTEVSTTDSSPTATPTKTPGDGPVSPVIRHYQALDRNDFDAASAAIHEDSPTGGELPQDAIDRASERSYTIDEVGEVDTDDDRTVVRVVFTETHDDSGASTTNELQIEVRQNGDVWKMWEILSFETLETTTAS